MTDKSIAENDNDCDPYLKELKRKHKALDVEIAALASQKSADPFEISTRKRRKLALKDKIAGLERGSRPVSALASAVG
jgi:hypothetical protein